jgi:hypothetical protein
MDIQKGPGIKAGQKTCRKKGICQVHHAIIAAIPHATPPQAATTRPAAPPKNPHKAKISANIGPFTSSKSLCEECVHIPARPVDLSGPQGPIPPGRGL